MTAEELAEEQRKEAVADGTQEALDPAAYDPVAVNAAEPAQELPDAAQEIIDRLNREAAEDEARKQQEIEEARRTAEANFNETTGAYSGAYGADGIQDKHKEQIDAILAEKDDALRDLIQRVGED
ncbi:MAG: hypothetical protein PUK75_05325 [bacterium]|nr:hypothetical protein [bacterium]MDY4099568.1 hypothetical protein [Lachnospiraceae bacterium]